MIAIGTRFFDRRKGSTPDRLVAMVERSLELARAVFVAVNVAEDKSGAMDALAKLNIPAVQLIAFPVQPWGFTFAMNALVYQAARGENLHLLSQSVEIAMTEEIRDELCYHMDDETMTVGARLPEHEFYPGRTGHANGRMIPWNTAALLNVSIYERIGFPLIGDAAMQPESAGVEEYTATALAQALYGTQCGSKLVEVNGINWNTEFSEDQGRREAHEAKMRSKEERPAFQLQTLHLHAPIVQHIAKS